MVRLNYRSVSHYNLEGGWGIPGTNILLSLSPEHLLFTEIGRTIPPRGERLDPVRFEFLQRTIIENAYRQVFAATEVAEVGRVRPRNVDAAQVIAEREQWQRWHVEQSAAERDLAETLAVSS